MVTKTDLIRGVLKGMAEPFDISKVLAAANSRLSQLPSAEQAGIKISRQDISSRLWELRHGAVEKKTAPATNGKSLPALPMSAPSPDTYTAAELTVAKQLLDVCGGSILRAGNLIKIIHTLTQKE